MLAQILRLCNIREDFHEMNVVYKDAKVVKLEITLGTRNLEDLTFFNQIWQYDNSNHWAIGISRPD